MKKLLIIGIFLTFGVVNAQTTGKLFDFNSNSSIGWGSGSTLLNESSDNGAIKISANNVGSNSEYSYFFFSSTPLDLSSNPYVSIRVKSSKIVNLRLDLVDNAASVTNASPILREVKELGQWTTLTYNFSGVMNQKTPVNKALVASKIIGVYLYINPGSSNFTGDFFVDDLALGSNAERSVGNGIPGVKLDQLGFYPNGKKIAIASSTAKNTFSILNESNNTVYTGNLGGMRYFYAAQDCVKIADFSDFTTPGRYKIAVEGIPVSHFFEIKNEVHQELSKAALKYYYYNRLSTRLDQNYAGIWARSAGHPDNVVYIHSSAATDLRPENTIVSAPKGWYDAGDYNKYVVNSGITSFTLMALYERFWPIYDEVNLNIPESGNSIPDLLDEIKWNLDWMIEMQDPNDGGVYFKLTSKNFTGDIMPSADNTARYMVGKSTSSALNYAATMAMAYRIYKPYNDQLNGFADTCIQRAYKAYIWAKANPNIRFVNPSDISTGGYGDNSFQDEFAWAAAELYISSQDDTFYSDINFSQTANVPGWNSTFALGMMSLSHNIDHLTDIASKTLIRAKMASAVSSMKSVFYTTAYRMAMSSVNNDYFWGSNAVAANQSMVLLQDYYNTGDEKSFDMAQSNLEYILGRNPLEYSFVTGFGAKSPMFPHHRPSIADGVVAPVPGMLVGGPNDNSAGECVYQYTLPALEYTDQECSYSTNEIAINWNAPFAFTLGAVEAKHKGIDPKFKYFVKGYPMGISTKTSNLKFEVYPNPATNSIHLNSNQEDDYYTVEFYNMFGEKSYSVDYQDDIDVDVLENGVYLVKVLGSKGVYSSKLNILK